MGVPSAGFGNRSAGARVETHYRDEILHLVTGPRLIVAAWYDAPTITQLGPVRRVNEALRQRLGDDGVAYCNVVISGTPSFAAEVREEVTAISRDYGSRGVAQAHLILVEGFAGTAVRAFLSTVTLLSRPALPVKVFAKRKDTERWLLERLVEFDPATNETMVNPAFDEVLRDVPVAAALA